MSKITHTHAIVAVYASRWKVASARTPDQWSIIKIGRRTAKRIYLLEQKPEYRWPADMTEADLWPERDNHAD